MSFSGNFRDDSPTPADAAGRRSAGAPARYRNESPTPAIEPTSSSESEGSMFATADEKWRLRRQNLQTKKRTKIVSHAAERQRRKPAGRTKSSKNARRGSAGGVGTPVTSTPGPTAYAGPPRPQGRPERSEQQNTIDAERMQLNANCMASACRVAFRLPTP